MYLELYIDILFVVNVVMNYILLTLVRKILKCQTTHFRVLLGSIVGSLMACILVVLPIRSVLMQILIGYIVTSTCMVQIGCNIKGKKNLVRGVLSLYVLAFIMVGIYEALSGYIEIDNWLNLALMGSGQRSVAFRTFLTLTTLSYIIMVCGINGFKSFRNKVINTYEVILIEKGRKKELIGFLDTGNHLRDPFSQKPVSILDYAAIKGLMEETSIDSLMKMGNYEEFGQNAEKKIRYIPFHSIGKEKGVLPAVTIDFMNIKMGKRNIIVKNPVLAVCKQPVSVKGEYQVVLSPMLVND
jgi:Sporulation factor SpoIIGA.